MEPVDAAGPELDRSASEALVLVVDDEPLMVGMITAGLTRGGYRALVAETGEEGLALATQYAPDLILLDLGLPGISGLEVTRELRAWSRAPIIVVSSNGEEAAKVAALDAGADDYVTKPFGVEELLARMRVALRHVARGPGDDLLVVGPVRIDVATRRVWLDGRPISLPRIEYNLLVALARSAGRVVPREELLERVWGPGARQHTNYLRVYMTHLRRKLELGSPLFTTVPGIGYGMAIPADDAR
ncbi:response regulator transcription factor [Myxococcota bacterium]|nr:response regulator transcription factor [Myxococcota bacterium]